MNKYKFCFLYEAKSHIHNVFNVETVQAFCLIFNFRMGRHVTKFLDAWSQTYTWITKCNDESSAKCTICKCDFKISNGGVSQVRAHASTKKHIAAEKIKSGQSSQVTLTAMCGSAIGKQLANYFLLFSGNHQHFQ